MYLLSDSVKVVNDSNLLAIKIKSWNGEIMCKLKSILSKTCILTTIIRETDLDEVLQIHNVFINVSKGQVASKEDLKKCFKTEEQDKVIQEILKKGELQIAEKERTNQLETTWKDIAHIVTDNCVNPQTKRPYTVTMIEKAMQDLHLSVNPKRSTKSQALDVIKQLQEKQLLPIQRAQMRIRITLQQSKESKKLRETILPLLTSIEDEDSGSGEIELVSK